MITPSDIGWGSYKAYEGVFFRGTRPFRLPNNPTENDLLLAVMTATEGGRLDAINGYDRCIISVGLVQWCEAAYHLTSKLLGAIASTDPKLLAPLGPALEASNAEFKKTARGAWRFHFKDTRGEVDTALEQKALFLGRSTGLKGSWDDASKEHAKLWAACMANFLAQDGADAVQVRYTAARMKSFAMPEAKKLLFDDPLPSTGWVGAMRAGFLSFAGNLPAVADKHLKLALNNAPGPKWSKDWCIHVFRELTFGPKITIYPHRYNAIRPVLEKLYGVDLPDMASELNLFRSQLNKEDKAETNRGEPEFFKLEEVQQLLSDMGYDLGPAGVDGRMGPKTEDAIMTFQATHGLVADGIVGPKTRKALLAAFRAKVCV